MDSFVDGLARFQSEVFPRQRSLYQRLAHQGQSPKALVISCSDSRIVPEIIAGGTLYAMDGETKTFSPVEGDAELPVALPGKRRAVDHASHLIAAD